jgi:uncharacterized protein (DUF302 family)
MPDRVFNRITVFCYTLTILIVAGLSLTGIAYAKETATAGNGVVRVRSVHDFKTTIDLLKSDIAEKGIMFFDEIDQSGLGAKAGIQLRPSTLLIFGNPPLGIQFLTSNPYSGLDWPVRLLVTQDDKGQVWAVYTDFSWIARRHHITNRDAAFRMASEVIASITSKVAK